VIDIHHLGRTGEVAGGMTQVLNDVVSWPFPQTRHSVIRTRRGGGAKDLPLVVSAARTLRSLDRSTRPVVVAHLSQGGSFVREGMLAVLATRRGLTVVAQIHGSSFPEFAARRPRLVRFVLSRVHAIHVLAAESEAAVRALGIDTETVMIPNAVASIAATDKTRSVVFGGAISARKGIDTLIEAWRMSNHDGWTLLLAGPHLEPELLESLPDDVAAPGALPRAELHEILARASIAVLPSRDEAMPLFILEAMAAGAAVIATPVGGVPSVIDDRTGILVPPGDAVALASALSGLMSDAHSRRALGDSARSRHHERFSLDVTIPQLEALWLAARDRT
jgi:glycosyltransferase involved in cell wall biosynthesis